MTWSEEHASLYVCDLGCNIVARYTFTDGRLSPDAEVCAMAENCGPRHLAVGKKRADGTTPAYAVGELDNTLTLLSFAADGTMSVDKTVSILPVGYDGPKPFPFYDASSHAAEVMVAADNSCVCVTPPTLYSAHGNGVCVWSLPHGSISSRALLRRAYPTATGTRPTC